MHEEGGAKRSPYQFFSPVTSTNLRVSPQNFLTFSVNPFSTLMENLKAIPSVSLKLLNLNQEYPSKKLFFFWSDPSKTEVMITSLIGIPKC